NLIFTNYIIRDYNIVSLHNKLALLEQKADELIKELYGNDFSTQDYEESWLLRDICPLHAFHKGKQDSFGKHFSQLEWDYIIDRGIDKTGKPFELFVKYHEDHYRKLCDKIISINTEDILNRKDLKLIQLTILNIMFDKNIVIETLPTSNIRIGIHNDYSTYHIGKWIKWKRKGSKVPDIVVGTDDTGIFATNIYNEYANIYCYLKTKRGWDEQKTSGYIRELNENSNRYRFG
uniref:hypothetical protein n=1 Tax=Sphingobacterium sp. TaxID=341027 RepID=UPI0028A1941D